MKKIFILICSIALLLSYSCNEDDDAIYISHKLNLEIESISEYYINFSWNETQISNQEKFILVRTDEQKENNFYLNIIDYYQNYDQYYETPDWRYECQLSNISSSKTNYERYIYSSNETHYYYKLLAYNLNGDYIISNTVYY
ncbi:MAG: hypothetical protein JEY96_13215 [Bacteroidales bacterium]|nr:hypothetical protein [Bacteroidales bacterium]